MYVELPTIGAFHDGVALGPGLTADIMVPVGPGLFAVKPPEAETWIPVTFYELPTGEPYVHFGVRATPRVSP